MTLHTSGDLDLLSGLNGYMINGGYMLWNGGSTTNLFVGANAGNAFGTGIDNTFVGNSAGISMGLGQNNTFMGMQAGYSNSGGYNNTANGFGALYTNVSGSNNTANGYEALYFNTASNNTAYGYNALYGNNVGTNNIAIGVEALLVNENMSGNTAVGDSALHTQYFPSGPYPSGNVAIGNSALYYNNPAVSGFGGLHNTAVGEYSLKRNNYGATDTATGYAALYNSVTASSNTAIGNYAGAYSDASWNTFVGDSAGYYNTAGTYNTFVGYLAGSTSAAATYTNTTCLGYQAETYTGIANNSINLGNSSIVTIAAAGAYGITAYSDRRIKDNIQENVPGLAFISKLHPVTYHIDLHKENELLGVKDNNEWPGKYDIEKINQSGFIAQQVDSAAQACSYNFNGLNKPTTPDGLYSLNYTAFIIPLVKSVQELNTKNVNLNSKVDSLTSIIQNMQTCLNQICAATGNSSGSSNLSTAEQNITLSSTNTPVLYQNSPNPFNTGTKINYYLPEGTMGASIVFYDSYGNAIKTVQISQTGNGTLNITADNLSNGIYSYSLVVNSNIIDTKRMVLQK